MQPSENNNVPPSAPQNVNQPPAGQYGAPSPANPYQPNGNTAPPQPSAPTPMPQGPKRSLKKLSPVAVIVIVVVLLGLGSAAAYFGYIVPNKPENIWKSALSNTAKGYDQLIRYAEEQQDVEGGKIEGSFSVSSSGVNGNANISANYHKRQGQGTIDVGFAGARYAAEIRAIEAPNADYPDVYIKTSGLDGLGAVLAQSTGTVELETAFGSFDEQWIFIDNTAFEQIAQSAQVNLTQPEFTQQDATELARKIGEINEQYLFSTNESTAVLTVMEQVGKEDFKGRESYRFKVGINKDNLKKYVSALKDGLRDTKLREIIGDNYDRGFDDYIANIDSFEMGEDDSADVWVDMGTKLIRNIRFTEKGNSENYFDISLLYDGGDSYPLSFTLVENDNGSGSVTLTLNTADDTLEFAVDVDLNQENVEVDGNIKLTPHNEPVDVQKPEDAKSINEIIASFMDAGALGGSQTSMPQVDILNVNGL